MTEHLRPYQEEGTAFLADMSARPNHLLGDEPGLGKTCQAIAACDEAGAARVLVLCLAIAKPHWQREFLRFQTMPRNVTIIKSQADTVPDTGVVVVNYDLIHRQDHPLRKKLMKNRWDVLILDESHALKNPDAKKTRWIFGVKLDGKSGLAANSVQVFALTGTPMPNHAGELWTHLHALAPELIIDPVRKVPMAQHIFNERYCIQKMTPWGVKVVGSKNLSELQGRLAKFMLRRRKKDVLKELPPLDFAMLPVDVTGSNHIPQALIDKLDELEALWGKDVDFTDPDQIEEFFAFIQSPEGGLKISTERRVLGEIKSYLAFEVIRQDLENDPQAKIIAFCHHTRVIDLLMDQLKAKGYHAVKIDGRSSPSQKQDAIDNFQTRPDIRVFVGQTNSAGTSVTLHASSNVIIVEPSFVPKDNVQAASRAHRFGQKNAVLARYLYLAGSLDELIVNTLYRKTRDIAKVLQDDVQNLGMPL